MSYTIWIGLHGAAAEEFAAAAEAAEGYLSLQARGARYLQVVGPDGQDLAYEALRALVKSEGETT